MLNFRTDLANERIDIYKKAMTEKGKIDGIESEKDKVQDNVEIERVKITNENGEKIIGKPQGNYITIDMKNLKIAQDQEIESLSSILKNELVKMIDKYVNKQGDILVVGLGNVYSTPDALGPKVINNTDVTRHIKKYMPQYIDKDARTVSAIAPGVLGTTGIETVEILKGIVENVKPQLIIVIDSLASKNIGRIGTTIQISDTGIIPGAGVGNKRNEISMYTLNIPVIAIGVPTVVDLATITNDCIDLFITNLQEKGQSNDKLNDLKENNNYEEIKEALIPQDSNMIVTPKEIDKLIENMSEVIASGINMSL